MLLFGGLILGGESRSTEPKSTSVAKEDAVKEDTSNKEEKANKENKAQIELNKPYTVTSSNGNYNITIEGIRFTDERNQFSDTNAEKVLYLDYTYENVNYTKDLMIFSSNFKIMDEQGNVLDTYPVSDNNRRSKSIPEGCKCSASEASAMPVTSKTLKIMYYDNMFGKSIGEVTI